MVFWPMLKDLKTTSPSMRWLLITLQWYGRLSESYPPAQSYQEMSHRCRQESTPHAESSRAMSMLSMLKFIGSLLASCLHMTRLKYIRLAAKTAFPIAECCTFVSASGAAFSRPSFGPPIWHTETLGRRVFQRPVLPSLLGMPDQVVVYHQSKCNIMLESERRSSRSKAIVLTDDFVLPHA